MPTIFSEDTESTSEFEEAHIFHLGTYIQDIKVCFKSQETLSEANSLKKVKFNPILNMEISGVYSNHVNIGRDWLTFTAGISSMAINYVGDCLCRSPMSTQQLFNFISSMEEGNYLKNSLFDADSVENSGAPTKYNTDWKVHVEQNEESQLLEKTGGFVMDFVKCLEASNAPLGGSSSVLTANRKNLVRVFVGPFILRYNSDFVHRIETFKGTSF